MRSCQLSLLGVFSFFFFFCRLFILHDFDVFLEFSNRWWICWICPKISRQPCFWMATSQDIAVLTDEEAYRFWHEEKPLCQYQRNEFLWFCNMVCWLFVVHLGRHSHPWRTESAKAVWSNNWLLWDLLRSMGETVLGHATARRYAKRCGSGSWQQDVDSVSSSILLLLILFTVDFFRSCKDLFLETEPLFQRVLLRTVTFAEMHWSAKKCWQKLCFGHGAWISFMCLTKPSRRKLWGKGWAVWHTNSET